MLIPKEPLPIIHRSSYCGCIGRIIEEASVGRKRTNQIGHRPRSLPKRSQPVQRGYDAAELVAKGTEMIHPWQHTTEKSDQPSQKGKGEHSHPATGEKKWAVVCQPCIFLARKEHVVEAIVASISISLSPRPTLKRWQGRGTTLLQRRRQGTDASLPNGVFASVYGSPEGEVYVASPSLDRARAGGRMLRRSHATF